MNKFGNYSVIKRLLLDDLGDLILVDSKSAPPPELERNVFLLGGDGKVLWQIEPAVQSHGSIGFSNVYIGENNKLMAYSSNGIEYTIDRLTGRILDKDLVR